MAEAEEPSPRAGPIAAAREAVQSFWGLLEKRLELASVEFQEQRHRLLHQLVWVAATVVLALLALFATTILVIALTWETAARNWVIAGVAVLYAGGAAWCFQQLKRVVAQSPPPFAATIEEFKKDRAWFRNES